MLRGTDPNVRLSFKGTNKEEKDFTVVGLKDPASCCIIANTKSIKSKIFTMTLWTGCLCFSEADQTREYRKILLTYSDEETIFHDCFQNQTMGSSEDPQLIEQRSSTERLCSLNGWCAGHQGHLNRHTQVLMERVKVPFVSFIPDGLSSCSCIAVTTDKPN